MIEVRGERFEEGETQFLLERRDDMRSIRMSCRLTGAYAGIEPTRLTDRMFDATFGRSYFRRWSKDSLAALEDACRSAPQAAGGS